MPIAHIYNGELGFDVRTKLNALIDQVAAIPTGGGSGDVVGPASAIADAVAIYNGTTGKLIKDGGQTIANIIASAVAASGTGDVVGPASAVNARIATYNGVTGKLIQDGGMTIADVIAAGGGGGSMAIGGAITSATAGSVLFAGVGGILAQDNANFFWDDSLNDLHIGGAYYIQTAKSIYRVPHVSGDNWFEGDAGNLTVTGANNFGTGPGSLFQVTSGNRNTALGHAALYSCTTGSDNVAIGDQALISVGIGNANFAMGRNTLGALTSGSGNVAVGSGALQGGILNQNNVAIGGSTLGSLGNDGVANDDNTGIGNNALGQLVRGGSNVGIGLYAGRNVTGAGGGANGNIFIGLETARTITTGSFNTVIGTYASYYQTGLNQCTILGSWYGPSASLSNIIAINDGNSASTPKLDYNYTNANFWTAAAGIGFALQGGTSGTVKINTKAVAGAWTLTLPDSAGTSGYVLSTDGAGVTSWAAAGGGGGGGTAILDGSGAPSSGTGAVGDYYVDNDDNIMYGPKAAVGAFGPDQIAIPPATTPAASGSGSYEVGARVVAAVAGEIYAVRYWRYTTTTQVARTVNVWTTGGALLSSGSVANDGGGSGWKQITLTTPVAVAASGAVFVSVNITNTYGETSSPGFPLSNGGDISITTGSYSVTPGTFPGTTFGNNFFVDAVFHVPVPTWPVAVDGDAVGIGSPVGGGTSGSILYVDSSSNLAQQNANLYFDDANNALKIGSNHTYNIDTFRALYRVPNVAGDNWFEGDAGNPFVTGHENFGTGSQCMLGLTTGSGNTGIGSGSMLGMQSGNFNFAFGTYALRTTQTGSNNLAVGPSAMQSGTNLTSNIGLGQNSLQNLGTAGGSGTANMGIGVNSLSAMTNGTGHIGIGASAGGAITTDAGFNANVLIGYQALSAATGTNYQNTAVGAYAGSSITNLLASTIVGVWPGPASALSNIIAINDGAGTYFSTNAPALDWNYTNNGIWSFHRKTTAQGLHVYNTFDDVVPTVNYERGVFDWRVAANVLTIGTQAGGTGTLRPVNIIGSVLTFNGSPIGGGGSMAIGGAITSATAGSVLFAGVGGVLAQDNTNFFWDDSLNDLHIGGAYYVAAARALYVVPHVTENNWFEGNSGNQTVTGYGNFGTGDLALAALTSGYDNVAVGTYAGRFITSGHHNFAMGSFAMWFGQTVNYNTAIGYTALATLGLSGAGGTANENNVAIGNSAMSQVSIAYENVAIGPGTLSGVSAPTTADRNTVIGPSAGAGLGSGGGGTITSNTMVGSAAGYNLTGASSRNTFVGGYRGPSAAVNDACCLSSGGGQGLFDLGITKAWTWSLSFKGYSLPTSLHIYNTQDALGSAINYERGIFDWVDVSNVFRIGVEAGGTGTVRPIRWTGLSSKATPIGADSLLLLDSASSGDMKTVLISTLPGGGGGGGMSIGGAITGGTAGRVLFAGVGGILDDDSTFTWNDTLKDLAIGGAYYVNAARALYVVPHVSGNNWFEGSAGNQTLTGYSNFGTGDGALSVLTSGHFNTALGTHALYSVTSGNSNTAIGQGALGFTVLDNDNFGLGDSALVYLGQSGAGGGANNANVGIGSQAMINLQTGASNVGIGFQSLFGMVSNCNLNVAIGASSGYNVGSGSAAVTRNVFIGADAGVNLTGAALRNTWIGGWRGPAASFNHVSVISDGQYFLFDCHLTTALTYSMMALGFPTGLHIYNTTDTNNSTCLSPTNYERAILDWNATANVFRIGSQKGGTGTVRLIAIDGFAKAGAPAAGDLPASSFAVIDDTSAGQTWLVFNKAGTIRKVQLT